MGMSEDDKRNCCLVEIHETEAKYYKTLEDIEKVSVTRVCAHGVSTFQILCQNMGTSGAGVGSLLLHCCCPRPWADVSAWKCHLLAGSLGGTNVTGNN